MYDRIYLFVITLIAYEFRNVIECTTMSFVFVKRFNTDSYLRP